MHAEFVGNLRHLDVHFQSIYSVAYKLTMSDLGGNGAYMLAAGVSRVLVSYVCQGSSCFCGDVGFINDVEHGCFAAKYLPIPPHLSQTQPCMFFVYTCILLYESCKVLQQATRSYG